MERELEAFRWEALPWKVGGAPQKRGLHFQNPGPPSYFEGEKPFRKKVLVNGRVPLETFAQFFPGFHEDINLLKLISHPLFGLPTL